MDPQERKKLIALYRDGYRAVVEALHNITPEELDAQPGAEPLVGARDRPSSRRQRDDGGRPPSAAARAGSTRRFKATTRTSSPRGSTTTGRTRRRSKLFRWARETTAEILERLTPAEWLREGTHTEAGHYGVEAWLKIYADHAHKHARQIREARDAAAKKRISSRRNRT